MKKVFSSIARRIAGYFLAGLLAILPLVLTVAVVVWVTTFVEGFIGPNTVMGRALQSVGMTVAPDSTQSYAIGWAVVLAAVFVLGILVSVGTRRIFQQLLDSFVTRIPIIGNVYGTSKQLIGMFSRKDESELKAMSVVFCVFGASGGPGVLALMPSPERFRIDGRDFHVVIIPTAPVPFGGGLLFMPVESVTPSDMSVDGLLSIYVSMGVTTPQFMSDTKDT